MAIINSTQVLTDFWSYVWHFKYFFLVLLLGALLLGVGLYFAEAPSDSVVWSVADPHGQNLNSPRGEDVSVLEAGTLGRSTAQPGNRARGRNSEEIAGELRQMSSALYALTGSLTDSSRRLKALEYRLQLMTSYLQAVNTSRRITPTSSLYYVSTAMLGLGDFGARTGVGRFIVVTAGWWGVLASGLVTALLVTAAMNQYRRR
jgi:hypothetical protein